MINESADNGIRDPDDPHRWLVPPWPRQAGICEVLDHFGHRLGWLSPYWTDTQRLVFHEAYLAAMTAAPKHELTPRHRLAVVRGPARVRDQQYRGGSAATGERFRGINVESRVIGRGFTRLSGGENGWWTSV
jgi:hypothetical protein